MSDRTEQLQRIREACIKAIPEIDKPEKCACGHELTYDGPFNHRPIRLADVLVAIGERGNGDEPPDYFVTDTGLIGWMLRGQLDNNRLVWNLRADDLTQQSDECVAFLDSLLHD